MARILKRIPFDKDLHCDAMSYDKDDTIFILYQNDALLETMDTLSKYNPLNFYELIGNTQIRENDSSRIKRFQDFVKHDLNGAKLQGDFNQYADPYNSPEAHFLKFYLFPLASLLLLTGVLSFMIIYRGMLQKMRRELTIHILYGALFRDVFIRFLVFYVPVVIIPFPLLFWMRFIDAEMLPFVCIFYLVITAGIILYIVNSLKRANLFDNLRGDYI